MKNDLQRREELSSRRDGRYEDRLSRRIRQLEESLTAGIRHHADLLDLRLQVLRTEVMSLITSGLDRIIVRMVGTALVIAGPMIAAARLLPGAAP